MLEKKNIGILAAILAVALALLACRLTSNVGQQVRQARETAQSVATTIDEGRDLLSTGQAMATEVLGSELVQTARAFSTQEGPQLQATFQAFSTQQVPGLMETAQAVTTSLPSLSGEAPADIPILEGEKQGEVKTSGLVTYTIARDFDVVLDFYKTQMPANGWALDEGASQEYNNGAELSYEKDGRRATVNITVFPMSNQTIVIISISS